MGRFKPLLSEFAEPAAVFQLVHGLHKKWAAQPAATRVGLLAAKRRVHERLWETMTAACTIRNRKHVQLGVVLRSVSKLQRDAGNITCVRTCRRCLRDLVAGAAQFRGEEGRFACTCTPSHGQQLC